MQKLAGASSARRVIMAGCVLSFFLFLAVSSSYLLSSSAFRNIQRCTKWSQLGALPQFIGVTSNPTHSNNGVIQTIKEKKQCALFKKFFILIVFSNNCCIQSSNSQSHSVLTRNSIVLNFTSLPAPISYIRFAYVVHLLFKYNSQRL